MRVFIGLPINPLSIMFFVSSMPSTITEAVTKTMGILAVSLSSRNIRAASVPRISGSRTSITMTSGFSLWAMSMPLVASDGFAEIYPEDKYKIVKLLQSKGHMVGMTGDGVNDAPALKQAELGIAASSSTDVAKVSASMVLTEPGLSVIQRMLTWVINKVTKVIQVIGLLTIGFFWFHDLVVSLLGMTLLIFANDFVTMSLATDNVSYTANPNKWNIKNIAFASLMVGALLVVDTHEQSSWYFITQASLDLKLGKYNFKNRGKPFPLHSPTCKHVALCPCILNRW